ncbi:hypothetical protein CFE70_010342 [Pyrenophora teres f. teres 0-1]
MLRSRQVRTARNQPTASSEQRGRVRRRDSAPRVHREQQRTRVSRRRRETEDVSGRCAAGARQGEMKIVRNAYAPKKLKDTGMLYQAATLFTRRQIGPSLLSRAVRDARSAVRYY